MIFFFKSENKFTSTANKFLLHEYRQKLKNFFFFQNWKNVQVQLISFCYIDVETIGKKMFFFLKYENIYRLRKYLQVSVT